ncbi:MAG: efflux RND transporter periplasmic adaptor subunit [Alphaproteobacteria bacterium]|nr:efflux RND transporter periplasmic adaptor subunit [Alphaproteobacteria bacterium]
MNQSARLDPKALLALSAEERRANARRRILAAAGGGALVLALLLWAFWPFGKATAYLTDQARRETLVVTVTATGTIEPETSVDVGTEISGKIVEVLADFNDSVEEGEVIARLDTEQLSARVVQSRANLAVAEASVAQATANEREAKLRYDRLVDLRRRGNVSQQELDTQEATLARAVAAVASAKAQVTLAEAQLRANENDLAKAEIRSPITGIVLDRKVEPGQTVAASFQTPVLFTLASDLTRMEVQVDIDEADIGAVEQGQPATFTVDAFPGRRFDATIIELRNAPRTTQNVVTYDGILSAPNPDRLLKPGLTATAEITVGTHENVLTVPNGALRFTPPEKEDETSEAPRADSGEGRVWVETASGIAPVTLTLGASNGIRTEVTGGDLKEGDVVLIDLAREQAKP